MGVNRLALPPVRLPPSDLLTVAAGGVGRQKSAHRRGSAEAPILAKGAVAGDRGCLSCYVVSTLDK